MHCFFIVTQIVFMWKEIFEKAFIAQITAAYITHCQIIHWWITSRGRRGTGSRRDFPGSRNPGFFWFSGSGIFRGLSLGIPSRHRL